MKKRVTDFKKILGIDYGRSKIGLAIAEGPLAYPLRVVRFNTLEEVLKKIKEEIEKGEIKKVVVGVSEGTMGGESRAFAKLINAETFDETLSTYEAQKRSILGGVGRKKRRKMEDAYAATIMLQNYLDS